jgi:hypothetical protein
MRHSFRLRNLVLAVAATGAATAFAATVCGTALAATPVAVYPFPNTHYNRPTQQIAFRGIPASQIGAITVKGSVTGVHTGHIAADSDHNGGSFLPDKPFAPGETVTVSTHLAVVGASNGTFSFQIARTLPLLSSGKLPVVPAGSNGLQHFRSRGDLLPASVTVTENHAPASEGDIFLAPQFGPAQDGPMILDSTGRLIYFHPTPISKNLLTTDFRVQQYSGQPVLTWWQGNMNNGHGRGEGIIMNREYQQIATVRAANGLDMGLHEFYVTPQGDAYINATNPVRIPGTNKPMIDSVIQEIDIKTGLVLFEWHAADHVPLSASYFTPSSPGHIFDPYHLNSIYPDPHDGNLLVSMRDTSAMYKVNHTTGQILWVAGGKQPTLKMGPGTMTWGQHDALIQPDGSLTVFDDGGGPPRVHDSRGVQELINPQAGTVTLEHQFPHSPQLAANFEGSVQNLGDGNFFLGWGQQPNFSEDTASGTQIFDAQFTAPTSSYRAYRFQWSGDPQAPPNLAISALGNGTVNLYASRNGANNIASWRVLGGDGTTASSLQTIGASPWKNFETTIAVHSAMPHYAVQAIGSTGAVLATSGVVTTPPHLAVFGRSAFVPGGGLGGIPAGCFLPHPCKIVTKVFHGSQLLAQTGPENMGANSPGILYFRLSPAGRQTLARDGRIPVTVVIQDASGAKTVVGLNLVSFSTGGAGPQRSLHDEGGLRIIGVTDFVSNGWVGGILTGCIQSTPCHVKTTLTSGATTIATTGSEFLGANELGYLIFKLTAAGNAMLTHAAGNQLAAHLTIADGPDTSTADIALVAFH